MSKELFETVAKFVSDLREPLLGTNVTIENFCGGLSSSKFYYSKFSDRPRFFFFFSIYRLSHSKLIGLLVVLLYVVDEFFLCFTCFSFLYQHTAFPAEVKDLTKKIHTVLQATAQMKVGVVLAEKFQLQFFSE